MKENKKTSHLMSIEHLGDKEIENLITQYELELRYLAFKYVRDWFLVDDIMQEVYLKIFLYMDTFENKSTIKSWLYKITSNQCIDFLRSKKVKYAFPTEDIEDVKYLNTDSAELEAIKNFDSYVLYQTVNSLPIQYRQAIILYYFRHFTYKEIGNLLNEDISTIKSRLFRGRCMLREKYFCEAKI